MMLKRTQFVKKIEPEGRVVGSLLRKARGSLKRPEMSCQKAVERVNTRNTLKKRNRKYLERKARSVRE